MLDSRIPRSQADSRQDVGGAATSQQEETVLRFDIHQRAQHGLMIVSFILLVLTGWPLHNEGVGASASIVSLFGGLQSCGLVHRVAAVIMAGIAVYHLAYLLLLLKRGSLRLSMLPTPKDARDVVDNLLYFVGLRPKRPRFPRFSYFEKFDYWAVFWGIAIMVGSGFIRWFPAQTTELFPVWVYEIAYFAHADEALLAALAIFIWHFYNVHLRPAVFPMSRLFITGRMTLKDLEEEHGAEYDALMRSRSESSNKEEGA